MYVVAYLKSLSIIDVDLAHLYEAHTSQSIIFVYIFEYPFFCFLFEPTSPMM